MTGQPARQAETATEAVRALNHATLPGTNELTGPADVYDTLGALAILAARLPQALAQLQAFLDAQTDAGQIAVIDGEHAGDPAAAAATVGHWTDTATAATQALQHALEQAHTALTWTGRA